MAVKISATALDRQLSDILNRVAYRGESFIIERGGRVLARLEPVSPTPGTTVKDVLEKIGHLRVPEGFADDLGAVRASEPPLELP